MKRRYALAVGASAFVLCGLACVDLFHGTDFDTLCTHSPNEPGCGGDGAVASDADAGVDSKSDVVVVRPHPDFCKWTSAEAKTQALRACAWLGACEGPLGESALGPCAVRAQLAFDCAANPSLRPSGAVDAFWSCLATVKSCGDVDGCVFPAGVQDCVEVLTGSSSACGTLALNATVRLKCAGKAGRAVGVEPCLMMGQTCSEESASVATCSGALGFDMCATSECSGTKAVDCNPQGTRTLDQGFDCANYGGKTCVTGEAGVFCQPGPLGAVCTDEKVPTCDVSDVNVISTCAGGKEVRVYCDLLGLPCDTSVAIPTYDPASACVQRGGGACTDIDKCLGNTNLQSCGRGALYQVDCASLGPGVICKVDAAGVGSCTRPP